MQKRKFSHKIVSNIIQVYDTSKNDISDYSNNNYNTIYVMTSELARKLSTETLTNRLHKQPFNVTILKELNKRATKVHKCQIEGLKRMELEKLRMQTKVGLGCKNEAYFTEEEMLNGFSCTYEDLSPSEKSIYDRL
jgi:hypothetical protein